MLGAWMFLDPAKAHLFHLVSATQAKRDVIYYLAYVLLGLGGSILLIGFFGCCGALQERRCMIGTVGNPAVISTTKESNSAARLIESLPSKGYI